MNQKDLLNFALTNGMIDLQYIQEVAEMKKKKELLENHKWAISQGKDGKWRTYLPDEDKGRKMIKRNSKADIENVVIEFYRELERKEKEKGINSFNKAYFEWRKVHDSCVANNTIVRYDTDFKRYFENDDFCTEPILGDITEDELSAFIRKKIRDKKLCKKAAKTLVNYMRNTFLYCKRHKIIDENPAEYITPNDFYAYCYKSKRSQRSQIISDDEAKKLHQLREESYQKHENYIPAYAVELASLTGMRVGELAALEWCDIDNGWINIRKAEIYDRKTKERYIGTTKNHEERMFPVTKEIQTILDKVKTVEMKNGYISSFVFSDENGRVTANKISSCSKNRCIQAGIQTYGIHAYRKTFNSKMRCSGVSSVVAASLLGHSKQVNEQYYTFDISTSDDKKRIIQNVNSAIMAAAR